MNKWIGIGRLVKAPEARTTPNGVSVTTFTIAISRRRDRETTDFINIVTWRGLADNCAKYLQKGQQVAVTGELQIRSYDAKDGTKKYITEIQADDVEFLARSGEAKAEFAEEAEEIMMDDDMLPF
ncbi:MAG: single-stranded DNA-binding protein [Christensenellaceae bacterium]|jgi:single-strand DNA-binding protein